MNNISLMKITFDNPYLLLLMIPIIALAFIPYLRLKPKRRHTRNKVTSLILHCLIIVLACFVLSGIEGHSVENVDSEIIFVSDYSDSTKEVHDEMNEYVTSFIDDSRNKGSKVGLVYFGYGECKYVNPAKPSELKGKNLTYQEAKIDSTGTDIEGALIQATSLFDEDKDSKLIKRIVLLSDAMDTDGQINSTLAVLNQNNIRLDAIYFTPKDYNGTAEAQIENIEIDASTVPNKETTISVSFKSHSITSVELTITDNGESIFTNAKSRTENLDGTSQIQTIEYKHTFTAGIHEIKANIKAINSNDVVEDNNVFYTYKYLEAENNILIIAKDPKPEGETKKLRSFIEENGYNVEVVEPFSAPKFALLTEYKEVILMDIDIASLPASFAKDLRSYVEKAGGSLLTAGGESTYANGNWKDSLYEDLLPINLTPTANNPRAIVLCLDYSNSMGMKDFAGTEFFNSKNAKVQTPDFNDGKETRIETAIKGIVESIKSSLNPYDYLSVITFGPTKYKNGVIDSDETNVLFGLTPATQKDAMIERVMSITKPTLTGGTDYDIALEDAYQMLSQFSDKKVNKKSVVLINDYDSGNDDAKRYMTTIQDMKNKNIDFSAVVIGNQFSSNVEEMKQIIGQNNAYLTKTETEFAMVIKDLCKSLPTQVVNKLNGGDDKFEFEEGSRIGIGVNTDNLPIINTYNGGVAVREEATSHVFFHNTETVKDETGKDLELDNHDPIYAEWSFGIGKVGSLMIDLNEKFCPGFFENSDAVKMLENIIAGLAPKTEVDTMKITVDGFLIEQNPEDIKVFNANYTRRLEIELLDVGSDEETEDGSAPIEQNISLDVTISKYEVMENKKTNPIKFTIDSKSGDKYEKEFKTRDPGIYIIEVTEKVDGTETASKTAYTAFSYSDEYDTFYDNNSEKLNGLSELCAQTYTESDGERINGRVFYGTAGIEENADKMTTAINKTINFQLPLMIIALLLFILDICVRKFNFLWPHEIIRKLRHKDEENI